MFASQIFYDKFASMKHFRTVLMLIRIVVAVLFVANFIFMVQLYDSIKQRYIDDVQQCLRRACQIELIGRIIEAGYGDDADVVWVQLGLQKSDVGAVCTPEEMLKYDYSQGYRRVDEQILSVVTKSLYEMYGCQLGEPDVGAIEAAFRRDLNFSGYYPSEVHVIGPGMTFECDLSLWHLVYRVNDDVFYEVYIYPLTEHILSEMSGVIISSVLIALALTFGFWYLLHVIARLRTIEEMKDDFINNMTHELKTPIAIAYAANDSLLQFPEPENEERTKRYLTAALDQLSKLTGLVENILAMSMERRKQMAMAKERIHLKPFIAAIIEQQKFRDDKECVITLDCPEDVFLQADPVHFSNILANLIDNSIKYSADSVHIAVTVTHYSITVADNGIGIPDKSLPYVFNKFYRVPDGNRHNVRGYGIGLFYVKSIVDKHGWHIGVTSRVGRGTTFTIKFTAK